MDDLYSEMAGQVFSFPEVDRFDILLIQKDIESRVVLVSFVVMCVNIC